MTERLAIWSARVFIFSLGILLGMAWQKGDFFKVDNFHDLSDIASSIATIGGLMIALTVWKKQIKAQADHDLARRFLIGMEGFKRSVLNLLADSQFCIGNSNLQYASYELIERVLMGIRSRMNAFDAEASKLNALLTEARAIWDCKLDVLVKDLKITASESYKCNNCFLIFINESGNPDFQEELESDIHQEFSRFNKQWVDKGPEDIAEMLNVLAAPVDLYLKKKLRI
jgi:hypothetical protein